jgi:dimethylhistidine N-methyltransferase
MQRALRSLTVSRPDEVEDSRRGFLADLLAGLTRRPRRISSRWFYDAQGSHLFQWISELPEYYLTRTERQILERQGGRIVEAIARCPCTVVDLGAGDGHKTRILLEALVRRTRDVTYAPIDVSSVALQEAARGVRVALPDVRVRPFQGTYGQALKVSGDDAGVKLVLFLGSSIGNLEPRDALRFLRDLRDSLRPGDHLLIGFDLVKARSLLRRAYADARGITRAFNLNLLARANRELGADFDLSSFRHRATWDERRPAMESWLESTRRQTVHVGGRQFHLADGERIHTEISCKFTVPGIRALGHRAGFQEVGTFRDPRSWFADVLWRVPGVLP